MGNFVFPVKHKNSILKEPHSFGSKLKPFGSEVEIINAGIDLITDPGLDICAVRDGMVISANIFEIVIDHDDYLMRYCGARSIQFKQYYSWYYVLQGERIGESTKMLHIEMYSKNADGELSDINNQPYMRRSDLIDPTPYFTQTKE